MTKHYNEPWIWTVLSMSLFLYMWYSLSYLICDKLFSDFWKPVEAPATTIGMDKQSILRHLEKTSPETLALAFEWDDIANSVAKTERILSEYVYLTWVLTCTNAISKGLPMT